MEDNHISNRQSLRYAGAALVRYMMLARLKHDENAFTRQQLAAWELTDWQRDQQPIRLLLVRAYNTAREINDKFLERCGSGGLQVHEGDPDFLLKDHLAFFTDSYYVLPKALKSSRTGETICFDELAQWETIDEIRELLNSISLEEIPAATSEEITQTRQTILLGGINNPPRVLGAFVPLISQLQYKIVEILLDEAPHRLSEAEIRQSLTRRGDAISQSLAVEINELVRCHENWRAVIIVPASDDPEQLYGLVSLQPPPCPVEVAGNILVIAGKEYPVQSHLARWMECLIAARLTGDRIRGDSLKGQAGRSKNVSREMENLKRIVPPLADWLKSVDGRGGGWYLTC